MRLQTFCGCLPLKVGVILIGSLTLIWAVLSVICVSAAVDQIPFDSLRPSDWHVYRMAQVAILTYIVVIAATGALMIHGARKRVPGFVFPWLARFTADLIMFSAAAFSYIIISPMAMEIEDYLIFLAIGISSIALHLYIWLVIYSFYKEITVEKYSCKCSPSEEKTSKKPLNFYHHI